VKKLSQLDLGWIVGFLEGEGCFSLHKPYAHLKLCYFRITASQKSKGPLVHLQSLVGGNLYRRKYTAKDYYGWHWALTKVADVKTLSKLICPLMSKRRQRQIRRAASARAKWEKGRASRGKPDRRTNV